MVKNYQKKPQCAYAFLKLELHWNLSIWPNSWDKWAGVAVLFSFKASRMNSSESLQLLYATIIICFLNLYNYQYYRSTIMEQLVLKALKKDVSYAKSGYLPHVALDLLFGAPTYLTLLGDVVYGWSLTTICKILWPST